MVRVLFYWLMAALIGTPAAALVQMGTINGSAGEDGGAILSMPDAPGVYGVTLTFDRPGAELVTEFAVRWDFVGYCDIDGTGYFQQCYSDDSNGRGIYRDDVPGVKRVSDIYHIDRWYYKRPYGPDVYENGFFSAAGARFDYTFADTGPVGWRLEVTRIGDVPEPAAWALMVAGFSATGIAVRRRFATPA